MPAGNQLTDFLFFYATSNSMSPVAPQMFEKPLHASFAYAGGRNLEHVEIRFIEDVADNPLFNTMSFNRTESSSDFVKWIAATMTREALASRRGETGAADRHRASLGRIDAAISAILGVPFRLEFHDDPRLRVLARLNGTLLTLDALPDGVKSIVSWIGDLLMRLDRISWPDSSMEVTARPFALFLDEIEVHLHPKWQRAVLPAVQHIFPNAQIFVATHSPFVVASVSGAWVHRLDLRADGNAFNHAPIESGAGMSYELVTAEIFGVPELFDVETEQMLTAFRNLKTEILAKRMEQLPRLRDLARTLAARGQELENIMGGESRQILRIAGIDLFAEEAA